MKWSEFNENYWDWADTTRRTRISSPEDVGSGSEIVEVIYEIQDWKVQAQLIWKAMKLGAHFTADDLVELECELPEELYAQLAEYAGLDKDDPHFDENNMCWSDFYDAYCDWSEEVLARRVKLLTDFGPRDEVWQAILDMPNEKMEGLLYRKAVLASVRFTDSELEDLGHWDEIPAEANEPELVDQTWVQTKRIKSGIGFLAAAIIAGEILSIEKSQKSNYCDGDCANCPPHYGQRYGRWYYGHGHQGGCERGDNGGTWGITHRD